MTAPLTHTAGDIDRGMSTTEVYEFLVAVSRAGHFHPGQLVARTGRAGQLLSLTYDPAGPGPSRKDST